MSSTAFAAAAENATRAADAYWAMQKAFYQPTTRFYREFYKYDPTQDQPIGYLWSFEEAARATLYLYGMPGAARTYAGAIQDRLTTREKYWDGGTTQRAYRSYPNTGDRYFDDNCWVGSDLLQHDIMTTTASTSTALDGAKSVFSYLQTGWTTNLAKPGDVPGSTRHPTAIVRQTQPAGGPNWARACTMRRAAVFNRISIGHPGVQLVEAEPPVSQRAVRE
jgi:hypothetical protein